MVQLRKEDFFFNDKNLTIWTAVETATAIIAASIPVLRVFFREKVSTLGYNRSASNDMPLSCLDPRSQKSGNTSRIEAVSSQKSDTWIDMDHMDDTASERSILGSNERGKSGILATSTVMVDYEGVPDLDSRKKHTFREQSSLSS